MRRFNIVNAILQWTVIICINYWFGIHGGYCMITGILVGFAMSWKFPYLPRPQDEKPKSPFFWSRW